MTEIGRQSRLIPGYPGEYGFIVDGEPIPPLTDADIDDLLWQEWWDLESDFAEWIEDHLVWLFESSAEHENPNSTLRIGWQARLKD